MSLFALIKEDGEKKIKPVAAHTHTQSSGGIIRTSNFMRGNIIY